MVEGSDKPARSTTISADSGGVMRSAYTVRTVKVYSIQESELNHISGLNIIATFSFSAASAFIGLAVSIWLEVLFNNPVTERAKLIAEYGPIFLIIVGVCAIVIGGIAIWTRGSILATIKRESHGNW